MSELVNFKFLSISKLDEEVDRIEFEVKGYKKIEDDNLIFYFKHDHSYKFIINNNILKVSVGLSNYEFDLKRKTEAIIRTDEYSYKASIITSLLNISNQKLEIKYILDFNTFKGEYEIILELY